LLLAAAQPCFAETRAAVRGEVSQPAVESVGLGFDLSIAALQARVKKLESVEPAGDGTAEAIREYGAAIDQLQQASDWTQRADALGRLQREGETLLQNTRTEIEAWAKPAPAPVSPHASQAEVEVQLAEADAKLAALRKGLGDVDAELARLAERRLTLPADLAATSARQEGLLGEFALPALPAGTAEGALARRASYLAGQKALLEQSKALELEIATQEIRRELLTARRDLLRRKVDVYAHRVGEIQADLAARRVREAEETAAQARAGQAALASVHPVLGALAEQNAKLAAERTGAEGLSARIDATARELSAIADRLQRLDERARGVRQKVAAAGLSDAIGLLLRKERADLPEAERSLANIRARREQIAAAQFQALNLEDELRALPALETEVEGILAAQADAGDPAERKRIEDSARGVLETRRSYLDALIRDYNSWFTSLVDLDAKESQFVRLVEDYGSFLEQNVLWIPNASLPTLRKADDVRMAAQWLVDPRNYVAAAERIVATARTSPAATGFGLLLVVTIEGVTGTVMRIEMRATTLIDGDRKELIIPNKALITGKIVNWSLHDPMVRLVIPVTVAHGSDPAAVSRILLEAAKQSATVLETPAPVLAFTKLGEAALEFELRVFVMDADHIGPTRHELLVAIERKLRAAGIESPVSHQDVTIKSISAEVARVLTARAPVPETAES
jgi:potassium efflux system protein